MNGVILQCIFVLLEFDSQILCSKRNLYHWKYLQVYF